MTRPINYPELSLPPGAMKTYSIIAPADTHFETITCAEADCWAYQNGWRTKVDESNDFGREAAYTIRNIAGRHYKEERHGPLTTFTFDAGQKCFRQHRRRIPKPEIFTVKDGDWRESANVKQHANADDWVEDFKTHQDKIKTLQERG